MTTKVASRFPAILIGGPPHSGKSVLARSLKDLLNQQKIECYLLRAAPDGEGDWFYDAPTEVAQRERQKGTFTPAWIERMCRDIAYRPLPFIVDVGGQPKAWQEDIFDQCTHAILLVKDTASLTTWQAIVDRYNLLLIAILTSQLEGESHLETDRPVLRGTITQLNRGQPATGPVFQALFRRVKALFNYSHDELLNIHQRQAPTDLVVDIVSMYRHLNPTRPEGQWQPQDLPAVFRYIPQDDSLALYGRGPAWLYAAVANYIYPHSFYQFDARLGWVAPVKLTTASNAAGVLTLNFVRTGNRLDLKLSLAEHYIDYEAQLGLPLPEVSADQGVVLSGKIPNWFYTGLTLYYQGAGWVAVYVPQLDQAIIVASRDRTGQYGIGKAVYVAADSGLR